MSLSDKLYIHILNSGIELVQTLELTMVTIWNIKLILKSHLFTYSCHNQRFHLVDSVP